MLRQRLPAQAAAASLITAPLLGLIAACALPPLRTGERAQIAAIAAQPGRWYIFSLFILLSSIMLVPAVLALMRLLGHTRPVWALLAGSLAQLGILIGIGDAATQLVFWQMGAPGADLGQMAALASRYTTAPGAALIFMIGGLAVVCGTLVLAAGLWRAHAVPAWAAVAVPAATIANVIGLSANSVPVTLASYALLLAAFARIAVIVRSSPAWDPPASPVIESPAASTLPARTLQHTRKDANGNGPSAPGTEGPAPHPGPRQRCPNAQNDSFGTRPQNPHQSAKPHISRLAQRSGYHRR